MEDTLLSATLQLATCTSAVWILTELVGRRVSWPKPVIAITLGPLLALGAYLLGFLTALPDCPYPALAGVCKPLSALFAGLISTLLAKGFHDLLGDRLLSAFAPKQ